MTRVSKQEGKRSQYPKKRKINLSKKTGMKKDNLKMGFKEHVNALNGQYAFIPKIK